MQQVILGLLVFGVVALFATGTPVQTRTNYLVFLTCLWLSTAVGMAVGATGRYRAAAILTVLTGMAPAWASLALDPEVLRGDYIPMAYSILPMMLAAILLGVGAVITVAALQSVGFVALFALAPASTFNWPSLMSLIVVVTVLASISALISQADLRTIEEANRRLHELQEVLREESTHDPLTGLFNRRHLDVQLQVEISRARRNGANLGLILVDLDHFKAVNDDHGHAAGDAALVGVADLMSQHSRVSDVVCRLGGDEFLLVLVDADLAGAGQRAERLRAAVQAAREDGTGPAITLSVGVAAYPEHGATPHELLRAADVALYAAKAGGRNRVAVAVAAPTPGPSSGSA